jgi:hypothetical protein
MKIVAGEDENMHIVTKYTVADTVDKEGLICGG